MRCVSPQGERNRLRSKRFQRSKGGSEAGRPWGVGAPSRGFRVGERAREGGREGGREAGRQGGREAGWEGGRDGQMEGRRDGGTE